jgi:hypothetical protein
MPVRLVPDALTAMASFFPDSRIWASKRRIASKSSAARPPGGARTARLTGGCGRPGLR